MCFERESVDAADEKQTFARHRLEKHQPVKKNINWSTLNRLVSAELFHQEQRDVALCGTDITQQRLAVLNLPAGGRAAT